MEESVKPKEAPLVSVVIPVKNEEKHVLQCLESVLRLDYPRELMEVIVVDNESSDNSPALAESRCRGELNVRLMTSHAGSIAGVRMDGFAAARGEVIGFVDGDTVVPQNWLRSGVAMLQPEEVSCVGFGMSPPERSDSWVERTWYGMSSGSRWSGTQEVPWLSSFNLLLKRKYFEQVGGFDVTLKTCEDADLGFRLHQVSRLIYSDKLTMRHLGNVKNAVDFFKKEMWRGQGNLRQFWKSGSKKNDYKSVFAPIVYLLSFLLLTGLLFTDFTLFALLPALLVFGLPVFLSFRARPAGFVSFAQTSILYTIYLLARGAAIVRI